MQQNLAVLASQVRRHIYILEFGGVNQPGNRFVSFVAAHTHTRQLVCGEAKCNRGPRVETVAGVVPGNSILSIKPIVLFNDFELCLQYCPNENQSFVSKCNNHYKTTGFVYVFHSECAKQSKTKGFVVFSTKPASHPNHSKWTDPDFAETVNKSMLCDTFFKWFWNGLENKPWRL